VFAPVPCDRQDDLPEFVRTDKQQRVQAMDEALQALADCRAALADAAPDAAAVAASAATAKSAIGRWLSLVPTEDVSAVDRLLRAVRAADADRDGKLDQAELATLPAPARAVWERRVALVGQ
jgi:hypothetical protein